MRLSSTYKIKLSDSSDDTEAVFTFKELPLNELLERQIQLEALRENVNDDSRSDVARQNYTVALGDLVAVEGLFWEDGTKITVEDIRELKVNLSLVLKLMRGYVAYMIKAAGEDGEAEKNPKAVD